MGEDGLKYINKENKRDKKKKIGILTFQDTNNYGSWLQTYALYKCLDNQGLDIEVINYQCSELIKREKLTIKKVFQLYFNNNIGSQDILWKKIKKQIWFYVYSHIFIKLSPKYNYYNIEKANNRYDVFMIGSDLVWDTRITGNDFTYMLNFTTKDKYKCSYAASLGYENIPDNQQKYYEKYLNRLDYISVREESSQKILEDILNRKIYTVCDPTLLLSKAEWEKFVINRNQYGKYVLIYFLDENKNLLKLAKRFAHRHGYKIILIAEQTIEQNVICINPKNISEFLTLIYYAQKIFTASYHGLIFSINFGKQVAYCNRDPKSRMRSVGKYFEIEQYEINNEKFELERELDYCQIENKIMKLRAFSFECIEQMIRCWNK